jgi:hypothetical protein
MGALLSLPVELEALLLGQPLVVVKEPWMSQGPEEETLGTLSWLVGCRGLVVAVWILLRGKIFYFKSLTILIKFFFTTSWNRWTRWGWGRRRTNRASGCGR